MRRLSVSGFKYADALSSDRGGTSPLRAIIGEIPDKAPKLASFRQIVILRMIKAGYEERSRRYTLNSKNNLALVERSGEAASSPGELPTSPLTNSGCNLFFFSGGKLVGLLCRERCLSIEFSLIAGERFYRYFH